MEVNFLNAGCGDAIHIRLLGEDNKSHNILIDGGSEKGTIYEHSIRKVISDINSRKELIDLWIISHIDDDHIGGVLRFLSDKEIFMETDLSSTLFLFNYSDWDYELKKSERDLKSTRQGILLRTFLRDNYKLHEHITDESEPMNFFGARITFLSPDQKHLTRLINKWKGQEVKKVSTPVSTLKRSKESDYGIKLSDFDLETFSNDGSEENASSIAFLLDYRGRRCLFTADSHPGVLMNGLKKLLNTNGKIEVDIMQIPHHGSKFNSNLELLKLIECNDFVVSADGMNDNNLPNKITLARVIAANPDKKIRFYITQENSVTRSIFSVDGPLPNVAVLFPEPSTNGIRFNFSE